MSLLPISIPTGFILSVKKNDEVTEGQVIARRVENTREKRIPIGTLLQVSPKKTAKYLVKSPGEAIHEGEVLARKRGLVSEVDVVSTISGTFVRFDRETGDVFIEQSGAAESIPDDITAPFTGIIRDVDTGRILLETKNGGFVASKATEGSADGILYLCKAETDKPVEGSQISVDMIGNIVLGPYFSTEALVKSSGMGVAGIIALDIVDEDIALLEQKRMLFPLFVVDPQTWQALAKRVGKKVYLDSVAKTVLIA
ncbi:MAG: hypothetical protein HYV40_06035 [Candidatus Levybacteria bacterium]|nr:hypothetical protein [Candidatus Levybacteria bacterium]